MNQFASTYLEARWFIGAGLIALTGVVLLTDSGGVYAWVVSAAGVVILAHAYAMRLWNMRDATVALLVDLTAALIATMIVADASGDLTPALLTFVGVAVLVALFSEGWARLWMFSYVAAFSLTTMLIVSDWDPALAIGGFVGALFVAALIVGVIAAIRARLVELEAARAQTIGVVSHELRNHLMGIIAAIELVTEDDSTLDVSEVNELLDLAHQQSVEAGEVIEDLLIASRAERGVLEALPELVDICPLTETVIRRTAFESRRIVHDVPSGPVWAIADPLRYKQVLRNLLTNALRYGGEEVRVSIETLGEAVSVIVADNGVGIDNADVSNLFQPYHRGSSAAEVEGSTGLGLWIARGLAHKMGGELRYRRQSGQTVFELTLPGSEPPQHEVSDSRETLFVTSY